MEDRKEHIRKYAIDVMAEKGYHNTTIKMIAERAGIAVGTMYNYFKNKEELLNYIFLVEHDKRTNYLMGLQGGNQTIDVKIEAFLDYHFKELKANDRVGKVLIQESMVPNKHNIEGIEKFLKGLPDLFAQMLKGAQADGEIKDLDVDLMAHAIFHAIRGAVYTIEFKEGPKAYERAKEQLTQFILTGIKR